MCISKIKICDLLCVTIWGETITILSLTIKKRIFYALSGCVGAPDFDKS